MIWEMFEEQFHPSWHKKMKPWIESEDCDRVYAFLKKEGRRGKKIAPLSSNLFRAFKETPYDELKVVFFGLAPYHTFRNGIPVADGLFLGCSITERLQPSLEQFYKAIERDLYNGLNVNIIKDPDVNYLAHQGVLMCNISLTAEMNKPASHLKIWEGFVKYMLEEALFGTNVPIVFFGKEAAKYKRYVPPFTWHFEVSHPASASYDNIDWESENVFKKINKILKDNNGFEIKWAKDAEI
jgi:uracil-DNA glycosylase